MQRTMGCKGRLYPTPEQAAQIDQTIGCCRYVYNQMLARQQIIYSRRGEHMSYIDMQNLLPGMKSYLPWLKEADSQALKYACRQLNDSYQRFFKGQGGFPHLSRRNFMKREVVELFLDEKKLNHIKKEANNDIFHFRPSSL